MVFSGPVSHHVCGCRGAGSWIFDPGSEVRNPSGCADRHIGFSAFVWNRDGSVSLGCGEAFVRGGGFCRGADPSVCADSGGAADHSA